MKFVDPHHLDDIQSMHCAVLLLRDLFSHRFGTSSLVCSRVGREITVQRCSRYSVSSYSCHFSRKITQLSTRMEYHWLCSIYFALLEIIYLIISGASTASYENKAGRHPSLFLKWLPKEVEHRWSPAIIRRAQIIMKLYLRRFNNPNEALPIQSPPPVGRPDNSPPIEMTFAMKCLMWVIKASSETIISPSTCENATASDRINTKGDKHTDLPCNYS